MVHAATSYRLQFERADYTLDRSAGEVAALVRRTFATLSFRFATRHVKSRFVYVSLKPTGGMTQ